MKEIIKWIKLEMEDVGYKMESSKWEYFVDLIETSSPVQQKRIQQRIMDRYRNKENFDTIVNHLINNLSLGVVQ